MSTSANGSPLNALRHARLGVTVELAFVGTAGQAVNMLLGVPAAASSVDELSKRWQTCMPCPTSSAATATLRDTLEMALPDWQWRRRTWPPHPDCGCTVAPG